MSVRAKIGWKLMGIPWQVIERGSDHRCSPPSFWQRRRLGLAHGGIVRCECGACWKFLRPTSLAPGLTVGGWERTTPQSAEGDQP